MVKVKIFTTTSKNCYEYGEIIGIPILHSNTPWTEISDEDYKILCEWILKKNYSDYGSERIHIVREDDCLQVLKSVEEYKEQRIKEQKEKEEKKLKLKLQKEKREQIKKQKELEKEKKQYEELKKKFK